MSKNKEKFSFSKITTFSNCNYEYYLNYVVDPKPISDQNIYGELGTTCHECIEHMLKNEMTPDEAIEKLNEDLQFCEDLDMYFPKHKGTDSIKNNYILSIEHYFDNFELYCKDPDYFAIEEKFETEIAGVIFRGFIDYYYIKDDDLFCIDFKTSSKFSKKDLKKKKLQLIIYAVYLSRKYPDKKIHCCFDMLKYIKNQRGTLKERHKLDLMESGDKGLVSIEFNNDNIKDLEEFIKENVGKIHSLDPKNENDWKPLDNCKESYFCKNLCGFRDFCKHYNK